jgi:hypothetical protein
MGRFCKLSSCLDRFQLLSPFADCHPADPHLTGEVRLGQLASLQQLSGGQATFFSYRKVGQEPGMSQRLLN